MRTKEITICGTTHLLTCSTSVIGFIQQHEGDENANRVGYILDVLQQMAHAGRMYAKLTGIGDYPEIDRDVLDYCTELKDIEAYEGLLTELISGDRTVDAVPPKNGEGAPGAPQTD